MNYIIKIAHGTEYLINADTLLDLYNQLTKLKSKHCYYDDEIVSIEEQQMVTKNKITITFQAIEDKQEIETAIERDIIQKIYNSIWNISGLNVKVEEVADD